MKHTPIEPLSLRQEAAARVLGISARTLFTLTKSGEVPHVRLNGVVLYPLAALREWLANRTTGGTTGEGVTNE